MVIDSDNCEVYAIHEYEEYNFVEDNPGMTVTSFDEIEMIVYNNDPSKYLILIGGDRLMSTVDSKLTIGTTDGINTYTFVYDGSCLVMYS